MRSPLDSSWSPFFAILALGTAYLVFTLALTIAASDQPLDPLERQERRRLCSQAAEWILHSEDLVGLERGKYLVRKLRCDFRKEALAPGHQSRG